MEITIEPVTGADLERVRLRLLSDGLPVEDLARAPVRFFAARTPAGAAIGWGGFEIRGQEALLRSVVVNPVLRGSGAGSALVGALMDEAGRAGVRELWLLTHAAEAFFARQGFARADRADLPAALRACEEIGWHDEDAACMRRTLHTRPA